MFDLKYGKELQGHFTIGDYNMILVFQVNCPGCFSHAIPLFNDLFHKHKKNINFLALSTAFEDFDFNTKANTKALIQEGKMIGETKIYFNKIGIDSYQQAIDFPIAMDELGNPDEMINEDFINRIVQANPNYPTWPKFEQESIKEKVKAYYSKSDLLPYTFTANQLQGTPSFVLFDKNFKIYKTWFGHTPKEDVEEIISTWLRK